MKISKGLIIAIALLAGIGLDPTRYGIAPLRAEVGDEERGGHKDVVRLDARALREFGIEVVALNKVNH